MRKYSLTKYSLRKFSNPAFILIFLSFFLISGKTVFTQSSITAPIPKSFTEHWLFLEPGDTVNGVWNHISNLQLPLFGVSAYYLENINKVFLCGGIDSSDNPKRECYYYDPQTNTYSVRSNLPTGRAYGKLVKVKDSLYLVGAAANFNTPDGALYKYNPAADQWQIKAIVPAPAVHEMAVCVWNDSLIIAIGGSTSGFSGAVNTVRIYNPFTNIWRVLTDSTSFFPDNISASQSVCIGNNIVLLGGFSANVHNKVYRGYIISNTIDSIHWLEDTTTTPFGTGVYRAGGGNFGNFMVFGPALSTTSCINEIWGFDIYDSTWTRFLPNTIDPASRTSIAVKHTADSLYFYLFGGITRDTSGIHFISTSEKYAAGNPVIGVSGNINPIPDEYVLKQNYPNPFNPSTTIEYTVPERSFVTLKIYDILGREVIELVNEFKNAGEYRILFKPDNLPSGIYFYVLTSGEFTGSRKMILLK